MKIHNPHTEELQKAIKEGNKEKQAELEELSRKFIEELMTKNKSDGETFKFKTEEKIATVKNVGPTTKENRKIVKQIYDEAILMNREFNDVIIVENRELKRLCREFLYPNQTKDAKEE